MQLCFSSSLTPFQSPQAATLLRLTHNGNMGLSLLAVAFPSILFGAMLLCSCERHHIDRVEQNWNGELTFTECLLNGIHCKVFSDVFLSRSQSDALRWATLFPFYKWRCAQVQIAKYILQVIQGDVKEMLRPPLRSFH